MFGTLLAFVIDRLDRGLRTGRQAEAVLNLPHIGLVPKLGGTCAGRALTFTSRRNRPRRTRKRSGACRSVLLERRSAAAGGAGDVLRARRGQDDLAFSLADAAGTVGLQNRGRRPRPAPRIWDGLRGRLEVAISSTT